MIIIIITITIIIIQKMIRAYKKEINTHKKNTIK